MVSRALFGGLAFAFAGIGFAGAALPGLPTVPFLLLAVVCARRGCPGLSDRIESHPRWGIALRQWRQHGAVPLRAKCLATAMMAASLVVLAASGLASAVLASLGILFVLVLGWLWSRPRAVMGDSGRWAREMTG